MIRPFTLLCVMLAAGSGLYLYQAKHHAHLLDRDIADIVHATEVARARSAILVAEWQLLNDTERLSGLADRFLSLRATTPSQFTTLANLVQRLPPVRVVEPKTASETDPEDVAAPITQAAPAPAPVKPVAVAAAASVAPKGAPKSSDHHMLAASEPPAAPRVAPETRVVTRSVMTVAALSPPRPVAERLAGGGPSALSAIAPAPTAMASVPMVASSLGMARTMLPPPVPLGAPRPAAPRPVNPAELPGGG